MLRPQRTLLLTPLNQSWWTLRAEGVDSKYSPMKKKWFRNESVYRPNAQLARWAPTTMQQSWDNENVNESLVQIKDLWIASRYAP